ncbi:hypothetical protein ACSS6W_001407 [Trichoderma asperelloides]
MTRNNLSGHLSWLLLNVALSKPTPREFPTTSDTSSFRFSQSQSQSADAPATNLSQATTASTSADKRISQVQASGSSNGLPNREALQDKEVVVLEDDSMGRLNLSTKTKKTSLLSQNGQLATPLTTEPQTKQRSNEPFKSSAAAKTTNPIQDAISETKPGSSRRISSPEFSADFADFDDDDLEYMDLTRTTGASDESVQFGDDVKVWTEKDASWEAPTKAKKRKSADTGYAAAESQFLDVYQLLGADPPAPTPGRRSATKAAKNGSSKMSLDGSSSPLGRAVAQRAPSPIRRTPEKDYAISSSERRKKLKVAGERLSSLDSPDLDDAAQPEPRQANEVFIPDSDDEFVTPPSNTATSKKIPAKPFVDLQEEDAFLMDVEDLAASPRPRHQRSSPPPRPVQTKNSDVLHHQGVSETQSTGTIDNFNEAHSSQHKIPSSSQTQKILSRILANPQLLIQKGESLDNQIQQNDRDFLQAINDRLPKDKRNEIKAEKERLIQQQKAMQDLNEAVKSYRTLNEQREAVALQVAQSYSKGVDTDDDEARLDELTERVESKERELSQILVEAGLDEANFMEKQKDPVLSERDEHIVVLGTQAGHRGMVNMSRSSRDTPLSIGGTQVVHQTQLPEPIRSQLGSEPLHNFSLPDRASRSASRAAPHSSINHLMDVEDDFFSDIDEIEMQLPPKATKKTTQLDKGKTPLRNRTQRSGNEFSDFSDDADMLAFAQDYEIRQSAGGPTQDSRQQQRLTANQCADILIGRKYPEYQEQNSDEYHGMAKGMKKHEMVRVIDRLSAEKGFHEENIVGNHGVAIQYLRIGPAANQFLTGRRKLMLTVQVSDQGGPNQTKTKKTKASKKQKEPVANVQSTYVSSPINRRRKRATIVDSDDESNLPMTSRGYVNDGFVVSDEEAEEDEADEEAFEPLPQHRPAKPTSKPSSKKTSRPEPVPSKHRLQDLPDVHQDVVDAFVQEARQLEERIRNRLGLRRPMFTDTHLQEMAINWTTSIDRMSRIPGIDVDRVQEVGPKLIPLLNMYHASYREIAALDAGTGASTSNLDQEIVDLISSDIDIDDDEEGEGEDSHYFSSKPAADVQAFHDRLQTLNSQPSQSRSKSSYSRGGGSRKFSGKKWPKRGAAAGGSQRRSGGSSRRGGGSAGGNGASSSRSAAGGSGAGGFKRDGKIVKKSGGGIGLMPL